MSWFISNPVSAAKSDTPHHRDPRQPTEIIHPRPRTTPRNEQTAQNPSSRDQEGSMTR